MTIRRYGDERASYALVQPVDGDSVARIEEEIADIKKANRKSFLLLAVVVDDWNRDLSPWPAPAVFANADFGGGAKETLAFIEKQCTDRSKRYIIGGYSLAGLFALWAACRTDIFCGVAAASPSVWFPGFADDIAQHKMRCPVVCLSLGDREARTRNRIMATVADRIVQCQKIWSAQNVLCTLKWNPGNHFRDTSLRSAEVFARALQTISCSSSVMPT